MKKVFLLLAVVFFTGLVFGTEASAQRSTFQAQLSGDLQSLFSDSGDTILLNARFPQGVYQFVLTRRAPFHPGTETESASNPLLYQGQMRRQQGKKLFNNRVAASYFNQQLVISFFGQRRGRAYQLLASPSKNETSSVIKARIRHVSTHFTLSCGKSLSTLQSAVMSQFQPSGEFALLPAALLSPDRYLEISTEADWEYFDSQGRNSANTNAEIQSILNSAEAIFLSQIGVRFELVTQHIYRGRKRQPLTTTGAVKLINEFRTNTVSKGHLGSADIYHLFTGKDIDSNIVGLAYLGGLCSSGFNFGFSQDTNPAIQHLITAHEIGHNFGADHDDDEPSLMSSFVRASQDEFSALSLSEIYSNLNSGGGVCLSTAANPTALLTVHARSSSQVNFNALVSSDEGLSNCSYSLYGAVNSSALSGDYSSALLLSQGSLSDPVTLQATVSRGNKDVNKKAVFFRSVLFCDQGTVESSVERVKVNPYGRKNRTRRFLRKLQNAL